MGEWQRVAAVDEVKPGQVTRVEAWGEVIALANVDGEFLAVSDVCSHEYVLLHDGFVEDDEIECPQHGSRFNLRSGAVRGLPATRAIPTFEVKVEEADLYIRRPEEMTRE